MEKEKGYNEEGDSMNNHVGIICFRKTKEEIIQSSSVVLFR